MSETNNNNELQHTEGGSTTRDATDLGVPMKPAEPGETRQGPEDALDPNTRGDYSNRHGNTNSFQIVRDAAKRGEEQKPVRVVSQDELAAMQRGDETNDSNK